MVSLNMHIVLYSSANNHMLNGLFHLVVPVALQIAALHSTSCQLLKGIVQYHMSTPSKMLQNRRSQVQSTCMHSDRKFLLRMREESVLAESIIGWWGMLVSSNQKKISGSHAAHTRGGENCSCCDIPYCLTYHIPQFCSISVQ